MGKYPHIPVIKPEYHSIMLHSTADIFRLYFQNIFHRGPVSKPHSPMLNSKATEMSKFPCCHTQRDRHWLDFRGMSLKCISPEREMALTLSFISFFSLWEDISRVKRSQWTKNNIHIGLPHHRWISPASNLDQKLKGLLKFASYPLNWKVKSKHANNLVCTLPAYARCQNPCAFPC